MQELQAQQVQQELAPQALLALLAFKEQQVRVSMEPQALPASLGPLAYKAPLVLALTAPLVQLEQPAQELQELLAPLALREPKAQQAPSASTLAQPARLVQALRVQQGYRAQQVLQAQRAPQVSGQPACRVPLELLGLPALRVLLG